MDYPEDWVVTPAAESWPVDSFLSFGDPAFDELMRAGNARLVVASQPLDAGQTEQDWVAAYFRPYQGSQSCDNDLASSPRLPIDGRSGYLYISGCPMAMDVAIAARDVEFEAFVFAGGRVYFIGIDGDVDLSYFEAVLATVKLDPDSAITCRQLGCPDAPTWYSQ